MASSSYGHKLNPYRRLRVPLGVKGVRQSVSVTNNPSYIDQNQTLLVRFPNLRANDVIVPGTVRLAFTIALTSSDANVTLVQNIGRCVVKKMVIRISGNEVFSLDDADVYYGYQDLWKTRGKRRGGNFQYQGIDMTKKRNVTKLRIEAEDAVDDAADVAVASAYGNRFCIPLDYELLESHAPFYQAGLGDRLEYELTFNDYSRCIVSTANDAEYKINDVTLEFDAVTNADLARMIRQQYSGQQAVYYDRILRHRQFRIDRNQTILNVNLNVPARSLKGVLMLFEDPTATFSRDSEKHEEVVYLRNEKWTVYEHEMDAVAKQPRQSATGRTRSWRMCCSTAGMHVAGIHEGIPPVEDDTPQHLPATMNAAASGSETAFLRSLKISTLWILFIHFLRRYKSQLFRTWIHGKYKS